MTKDEKAAYWRQQIDGFQASGLSTKHYCAREGIAVATLCLGTSPCGLVPFG